MTNPKDRNGDVKVIYHFAIIVLVNDKYQKKINKLDKQWKNDSLGNTKKIGMIYYSKMHMDDFVFPGNTKKRYLKWKKKYYKRNPYMGTEVKRLAVPFGGIDKYENLNCQIINQKEIERLKRKYKKYFEKSKELGKNSIVLGMFIYLKNLHQDKKFYPKSTFIVPLVHFSEKAQLMPEIWPVPLEPGLLSPKFQTMLHGLVKRLYEDLEYDKKNYMDRKTYNKILEDIGDIGYEIVMRKRLSREFRKMLGRFKKNIGGRVDPVTDFCYRFFDDLEQYLSKKKNIRYCPLCGNFYRSEKESMYCEECSKQRGEDKEIKAYDEIKEILEEYGISQNMPLEDIYDLSIKLIGRKDIILKLLREKKIRENPKKTKSSIDEELSDRLLISESLVKHAKY